MSFGQKIRFTDSANRWLVHDHYIWGENSYWIFNFVGDTIVSGIQYKRLKGRLDTSLVREDTITHKVYVKNFVSQRINYHVDTAEELLYDFNLQLHDTFIHFVDTVMIKDIVNSIDSVTIQGVSHKVWLFYYYTVIEGIGCLDHPILPASYDVFEMYHDLVCFSNEHGTPLITPGISGSKGYFDNFTSCTAVVDDFTRKKNATIFPNPIDITSKIVLPYKVTSGKVSVVDDIGQMIINMDFENKEELQIGDKIKVPGIYYYRVTDNTSGKVFSGKFVRE